MISIDSKITILMTCYNHQNFVEQAIESVINQSFRDWHLVILDDNSNDNSTELIRKIADKHENISAIFGNENLGKAERLNTFLPYLQTPYFAFIDSDDYWVEDKLKHQVEIFDKENQVDVIYTNGFVFKTTRKNQTPWEYKSNNFFSDIHRIPSLRTGKLYNELLNGNFIFYSSSIMKTSTCGGIKFRNIPLEDWVYWVDIASLGLEFKYIDSPLAYYRIHGENAMINSYQSEKFILNREIVYEEHKKNMPQDLKAKYCYILSRGFKKTNKIKRKSYSFEAIKHNPISIKYCLNFLLTQFQF